MRFNWWLRFVYHNGFMAFSPFSSIQKIFFFNAKNQKKKKITVQITCAHSHSDTCPPHTFFQFVHSIYNFVEFFSRFNKPSDEEFVRKSSKSIKFRFYCFFALLFSSVFPFASFIQFHGHSLNIYYFQSIGVWCLNLILRIQRSFEWNLSLVYMTNMNSQFSQISTIYHVEFSMSFITTLLIRFYLHFKETNF